MAEQHPPAAPLEEILDRAVRQETRRFVRLLDRLYTDPDRVRAALRAEAASVGPRAAGRLLGETPHRFGTVRPEHSPETVSVIAREAGYVGGLAHELQASRGNPILAAKLLSERFAQAARGWFQDPERFYEVWSRTLSEVGPQEAARRLQLRPDGFGTPRPGIEAYVGALAGRGVDAAYAKVHATAFQRDYYASLGARLARLPRSTEELVGRPAGRLPPRLEMKLEAFTADFRGKLTEAYASPAAAEDRFHDLVAREGTAAAVALVRAAPERLGDLSARPDAPQVAELAARRGARAYELNGIRNPAHAAEVLQQDTERSFARQCANPGEALQRILRAIRSYGLEPTLRRVQESPGAFFQAREGEPLDVGSLSADVRALGNAEQIAASFLAAEDARMQQGRPVRDLPVGDPAHRAVTEYVEAEALSAHKADLHARINQASTALHQVETTARWEGLHERQLLAALRDAYRDPAAARDNLLSLAEQRGSAFALRVLQKNPHRLGELKTQPAPLLGWIPVRSTAAARKAAGEAVPYADALLRARKALRDVEWTDPGGTRHPGAERVQAASTREIATAATELRTTTETLRSLGGVSGARERAVAALSTLPEEKGEQVLSRAAAENPSAGESVQKLREAARKDRSRGAGIPGTAQSLIQSVQTTRTLAEGPGSL